MSYNISTIPVWRTFNKDNLCPLCEIREKTTTDVIDSYLNEAVMEDGARAKVNKRGFCKAHFDVLLSGNNKCGLALQMTTRIEYLNSLLKAPSVKNARKFAEKVEENLNGCVVCDEVEFNMSRYFETIPKLYKDDEKFREEAFKNVNGFCFADYLRLLKNAAHAGKFAERFISELTSIQKSSVAETISDLKDFTGSFDYRRSEPVKKNAALSLKAARIKLYGKPDKFIERK